MNYEAKLDAALGRLHEEGRYRVFIDIERENGNFPHASWTKPDGSQVPVTIWCGNDYLGMGQHPVVLEAMHEALDATGAGSGGTRNISGTTVYHKRLEAELADLDDEDRQDFLADLGLEEPGLHRLIRAGYQLLGLQTYFTAGVKEVRAWTIRAGDTAPKAAGVIHGDFERGFIKAETVAYDDLIACGSTAAAREKGKYRIEGKEYVVQDGDVLLFRFNV